MRTGRPHCCENRSLPPSEATGHFHSWVVPRRGMSNSGNPSTAGLRNMAHTLRRVRLSAAAVGPPAAGTAGPGAVDVVGQPDHGRAGVLGAISSTTVAWRPIRPARSGRRPQRVIAPIGEFAIS